MTLTAFASANVGPTTYYIQIFNANTGELARQGTACYEGLLCSASVSRPSGTNQAIRARIARADGSSVQATSDILTISWGGGSKPGVKKLEVRFESQQARKLDPPYQYPRNGQNGGDNCGPASVSMVLQYYNKALDFAQVVTAIRHRRAGFTSFSDFTGVLDTSGLSLSSIATLEDVKDQIDIGHPLLMAISNNSGRSILYHDIPGMVQGHIVVVTGYSNDSSGRIETLFINDPLAVTMGPVGEWVSDSRDGFGKGFVLPANYLSHDGAGWSAAAVVEK